MKNNHSTNSSKKASSSKSHPASKCGTKPASSCKKNSASKASILRNDTSGDRHIPFNH